MMNRTPAVFFLFLRRPGEFFPLFWLAGAFVLGFLWSLAYASGLVAEGPLPWPAGRLMFAFYGMLVYGWALPVLFSVAAGSGGRGGKPARGEEYAEKERRAFDEPSQEAHFRRLRYSSERRLERAMSIFLNSGSDSMADMSPPSWR